MRKYEEGQSRVLMQAVCNKCGRQLKVENGYLKEGCFSAHAVFGYFSRRDGSGCHFDLCEDCFDELLAQFVVPAQEEDSTELL